MALLLETSLRGVFAAGGVRSGSVKWVASTSGEGAVALRLVQEHREKTGNLVRIAGPEGRPVAGRREALGIVLVSDEGTQRLRCEQERRSDMDAGCRGYVPAMSSRYP